jgi:hypothetical protein
MIVVWWKQCEALVRKKTSLTRNNKCEEVLEKCSNYFIYQ